jgi:cytochrome P450 / NADPH-cytochrome P450 reductase
MGGSRIVPLVLGNVAKDIFGAYDEFTDNLWKALDTDSKAASEAGGLKLDVTLDRPELLGEKYISLGTVRQHIRLADTSVGPEKRLMDVDLPEEITYRCGDYLVVLPTNRNDDVRRVLNFFHMAMDSMVKISNTKKTFLVSATKSMSEMSRADRYQA